MKKLKLRQIIREEILKERDKRYIEIEEMAKEIEKSSRGIDGVSWGDIGSDNIVTLRIGLKVRSTDLMGKRDIRVYHFTMPIKDIKKNILRIIKKHNKKLETWSPPKRVSWVERDEFGSERKSAYRDDFVEINIKI